MNGEAADAHGRWGVHSQRCRLWLNHLVVCSVRVVRTTTCESVTVWLTDNAVRGCIWEEDEEEEEEDEGG